MAVRIKQRRGTAAEWAAVGSSVILANGEVGVEYDPLNPDEQKFKIGDGTSSWNDLAYYENLSSTISEILSLSGLTTLSGLSDKIVPPGGTTDQLLAKSSNSDYEFEWVSPSALPISLNDISDVNTSGVVQNYTLLFNGTSWTVGKPIGRTIFVQATEPTGAVDGDLWFW